MRPSLRQRQRSELTYSILVLNVRLGEVQSKSCISLFVSHSISATRVALFQLRRKLRHNLALASAKSLLVLVNYFPMATEVATNSTNTVYL